MKHLKIVGVLFFLILVIATISVVRAANNFSVTARKIIPAEPIEIGRTLMALTSQPNETEPVTEEVIVIEPEPEEPTFAPYDVPLSESIQHHIWNMCDLYSVPMPVILAIISIESNYQTDAISPTNDYGLMQINHSNFDYLSAKYRVDNFLDPYQNTECGIRLLGEYLEQTESLEQALMLYNLGPGNAYKKWEQGVYSTAYTEKVIGVSNDLSLQELR